MPTPQRTDITGPTNEVTARVKTVFTQVADALDKFVAKPAGKAAQVLRGMFDAIDRGLANLGGSLARFVQLSNPGAVFRFTFALRDLQAVIGQTLTPALESVTRLTRQVADALASLNLPSKSLLSTLAGAGPAAAGAAGVTAALVKMAGLGAAAGPLGAVAAVVVLALEKAGELDRVVRATVTGIGSLIQAVAGPMNAALAAIGKAIAPVVESIGAVAGAFGSVLAPVFQAAAAVVAPLAGAFKIVATVLNPVVKLFAALAEVIGTFAEGGIKTITTVFGSLFEQIGGPLAEATARFASGIEQVIRGIEKFVNGVRESFGLDPLFKAKEGASVGAAVRGGQIGDLQGFIRKAYESAAASQIGKAGDPQLSTLKSIDGKLETLPEKIARAIVKTDGGKGGGETVVGRAINSAPLTPLPGGPTVGEVRAVFRQLFN